jgi:hypothetical protein
MTPGDAPASRWVPETIGRWVSEPGNEQRDAVPGRVGGASCRAAPSFGHVVSKRGDDPAEHTRICRTRAPSPHPSCRPPSGPVLYVHHGAGYAHER